MKFASRAPGDTVHNQVLSSYLKVCFCTIGATNDVAYNISETWSTREVDGFDNLPDHTETRTPPENYDLSPIVGVVRIAGADLSEVNGHSSNTNTTC